jgi:hypothetical protein
MVLKKKYQRGNQKPHIKRQTIQWLIPLYYLSLDLWLLITSLVLFLSYHCIICPSIYGFRSPLWYFFFNTIVFSVPPFTVSNDLFGIFSLIPLYYLSLDLWLLIIEGQTIPWYEWKSTKEVIRSRKSRYRQYNGIKEKVPKEVIRSRKSRDRQYNWLLFTSLVLFFNTIVLSVSWYVASDYLFGTFSLIPLHYLSPDLRLLITSLTKKYQRGNQKP